MLWARSKAIGVGAALQLVAAGAAAQSPAVEQLFPAQPAGLVTDVARIIDPTSKVQLDDLLTRLRAATGAEVAVVTLPTVGDREASEVALAIGRRWGVGARAEIGDARRNAGAVVLLVPRQEGRPGSGQIRIETGQGLEGIVTDADANAIYRQVMGPELAQERYGPALVAGVQALASLIARGFGVTDSALTAYEPPRPQGGGRQPSVMSLLPILLIVAFIVMANGSGRGRGRGRGASWGGPWIGGGRGGFGGGGGGFGGGGFGGFGGGGGFSGGGSGGRF